MTIALDKILTMSAQDYVGSGLKVKDGYNMVGVHFLVEASGGGEILSKIINKFASQVPDNAEAVVNYQTITSANKYRFYVQMSGTALIPKRA